MERYTKLIDFGVGYFYERPVRLVVFPEYFLQGVTTPGKGEDGLEAFMKKAITIPGWTANPERMARTDNAIYTHPMPVDRGSEVTDEVASGPRSAIYDIAENRLHVQKAVMALTMGNL